MTSSVRQTCKICKKSFEVPYQTAWKRRYLSQKTNLICGSACRDIVQFMLNGKDMDRPVLSMKHGTSYAYRKGCRCGDCCEASKACIRKSRERRSVLMKAGEYEFDGVYTCAQCGISFRRALSIARGSFKHSKSGKFYCTIRCSSTGREKAKQGAK